MSQQNQTANLPVAPLHFFSNFQRVSEAIAGFLHDLDQVARGLGRIEIGPSGALFNMIDVNHEASRKVFSSELPVSGKPRSGVITYEIYWDSSSRIFYVQLVESHTPGIVLEQIIFQGCPTLTHATACILEHYAAGYDDFDPVELYRTKNFEGVYFAVMWCPTLRKYNLGKFICDGDKPRQINVFGWSTNALQALRQAEISWRRLVYEKVVYVTKLSESRFEEVRGYGGEFQIYSCVYGHDGKITWEAWEGTTSTFESAIALSEEVGSSSQMTRTEANR